MPAALRQRPAVALLALSLGVLSGVALVVLLSVHPRAPATGLLGVPETVSFRYVQAR